MLKFVDSLQIHRKSAIEFGKIILVRKPVTMFGAQSTKKLLRSRKRNFDKTVLKITLHLSADYMFKKHFSHLYSEHNHGNYSRLLEHAVCYRTRGLRVIA